MQAIVSLKCFEKIVVDLMLEKTRILFEVGWVFNLFQSFFIFKFHAHPFFPVLEAARRRRALELSAVRKGRAKFISLA